jgi:Cu2+-exporting ATPase
MMKNSLENFCSHCLLSLGSQPTQRIVNGEEHAFCCYGCCLAFQVKNGSREEPEAAWLLVRLGIGGFLSMNIMLFSLLLYSGTLDVADSEMIPKFYWLLGILATPVIVILGVPFFKESWDGARQGRLNSATLISIGALSAYGYSLLMLFTGGKNIYFDTATMILVLFTLGRYLEASGRAKAVRNVAPLLEAERQSATVIENGIEKIKSINEIKIGMKVRVLPGERISVDGKVLEGISSTDESILTGENRPVSKYEGDLVLAGSINQHGSLLIECGALGSNTQWGLICQSVRESLSNPSSIQRLADRAAIIFVPIVLSITILTIIYWQSQIPLNQALLNGLAVLVVACPCALGLAAPLATALGMGQFLKRGCLIRGGEVQETLAKIRRIAFDKTGTLTKGATSLIKIENDDATQEAVLQRAAGLEQHSEHSLAHGIVSAAKERKLNIKKSELVQAVAGSGIIGYIEGELTAVGRSEWMKKQGMEMPSSFVKKIRNYESSGQTVVCVGWSGKIHGILLLDDMLIPEVPIMVKTIQKLGMSTVLLTGDLPAVASRIAKSAGIEEWEASMSPEDKCVFLEQWGGINVPAIMVGDGLNDGPVLARAEVGIAVGAATDLARETADLVLPENGLALLPWVISLSRAVHRTIVINLLWAFGYNIVAISLAAFGLLQPILAAGLMAGSSLIVVFNSLRLEQFPDNQVELSQVTSFSSEIITTNYQNTFN